MNRAWQPVESTRLHPVHTQDDPCDPRQNQLLAALPAAGLQALWPHLQAVDLPLGKALCAPGRPGPQVVFPTTALVSLRYTTRDGDSSEIAVVGNDGVVGVAQFMGGGAQPAQAVVQSAGRGYALCERSLTRELVVAGPLMAIVLRYAEVLIAQVAQTAACNRHHTIDQQFCRRLLLGLDRLPSDELEMTHETMAGLLGVRREGVTAAAVKLQRAGIIRYRRGRIAVLDRQRLERSTCECYAAAKREQDRLLPMPPAALGAGGRSPDLTVRRFAEAR